MTQPVLVMSTVQAVLECHTPKPSPLAMLLVRLVKVNEVGRVMEELRALGFLEAATPNEFRITRRGRALLGDPR